mmetsp:Transcript_21218/g.39608  ORF Transcript_21218/g.39608 Transcript_21218/m.39608 type:complete len:496 (-) Transcript_21218:884-2371(-)
MGLNERPLNALETLFAAANVRFSLLIVFDQNDEKCVHDLRQRALQGLETSPLGYLELQHIENDANNTWKLIQHELCVGRVTCRTVVTDIKMLGSQWLQALVQTVNEAAQGALVLEIIMQKTNSTSSDSDNTTNAIGLFVNVNHAMADGRSLTRLVEMATTKPLRQEKLSDQGKHDSQPTGKYPIIVPDWHELVKQCMTTRQWDDGPAFLPGNYNMLTIDELCAAAIGGANENRNASPNGSESYEFEFSADTIIALRKVIKKTTSKHANTTLSGFLAAVLMRSLAMEYTLTCTQEPPPLPRDIGISMLVDLRPQLKQQQQQQEIDVQVLPQAFGTVTLMESTDRLTMSTRSDDTAENDTVTEHKHDGHHMILALATELTQQLRRRIERGEALRTGVALASGQFENAGPPATLEVSNLGVCRLPKGAKLYTAQRFDGYDGVSCMIHSESYSNDNDDTASAVAGCMRWNVSVGQGLDGEVIQRVFTRAAALCEQIAKL